MSETVHRTLPCGIEYAVAALPRRHVVAFQIRLLAGACDEPADMLGLAQLVEHTLDKGTEQRSGRELLDALDAIGATTGSGTGRETTTFSCTTLPEHFEEAVSLHADFLRRPTFPDDAVEVNRDLAQQELLALEDDAHSLIDKHISRLVYGPILGRHPLGEVETLGRIGKQDLHDHWKRYFHAGRMLVTVAGAIDAERVADVFERHFSGFGESSPAGRESRSFSFEPTTTHHHKDLEQQHIGICFPGVGATHADFPIQKVMLGILSGGMSSRLFTEVREKQGLVYYVNAWQDVPRGGGMIFLGASTMPDRCDKTMSVLRREVDRISEDVTQEELDRAITGLVTPQYTRGETTRSRCGELGSDLFFYGRPVPPEEKTQKIEAVTLDDVKRYLDTYPRDRVAIMTLGPRGMTTATEDATATETPQSA